MKPAKIIPSPRPTAPHTVIVAGVSLMAVRKELKPALPKKKQEASYLVVITAAAKSVKVAIAGAAIELPAVTSGPFIVELPYLQFKSILTDSFEDGALIRFEFSAGSFSVNGMATKSPHILVKSGGGAAVAAPPASSAAASVATAPPAAPAARPVIANPLDAPVGLPLLAAYVHLRKYGPQPFAASKTFIAQQAEVDDLLKKADRLLEPLGITRADLERLLDRKTGLV